MREQRRKARRKIVQRREFFLFRCGDGGIGVLLEIRFVSGNIHIRKLIRVGRYIVSLTVCLKSFFGRIFFYRLQRGDRPVFTETEYELCRLKRGIIVQISHRAHLSLVVFRSVFHSRIRIFADRKRHGEDIFLPVFFCDGVRSEKSFFGNDVIAKLRRPQPVSVDVLFFFEHFRRFTRRPLGIESVPICLVIRSGIAHDGKIFAIKTLHSLGRSKRTFARADRRDDEHAFLVIFTADNVLLDVDHSSQCRSVGNGGAFRVIIFL